MAKLIHVKATNLLGLKSADVSLKGRSAVIGGRNGQGKSSFQKAIQLGLAGADSIPGEPVHGDAESGEVLITLDNGLIVHRTVGKDRKTRLTVRQEDNPGMRFDKPQATLDALFGDLSFDPGEFLHLSEKQKVECLMKLAGIDFAEQNKARAAAYDERTMVGRDVKRLEGELSGRPEYPDAPEAEIDPQTVLDELSAAQKLISGHERDIAETKRLELSQQSALNAAKACSARNVALQEQIDRIKKEMDALTREQTEHNKTAQRLGQTIKESRAAIDAFQAPDVDAIKSKAKDVEKINAEVRANRERAALVAKLAKVKSDHVALDTRVRDIDAAKTKALESAALPIEGMTFDESGVRYNGQPFEQCSESEQWAVATAVAFARNPQGVVFVSRSGGMDKDTRARVLNVAAERGVQVLLEVVDDADDVTIVFDHGQVAENRLDAESPASK